MRDRRFGIREAAGLTLARAVDMIAPISFVGERGEAGWTCTDFLGVMRMWES
jgi:hypothetical protein